MDAPEQRDPNDNANEQPNPTFDAYFGAARQKSIEGPEQCPTYTDRVPSESGGGQSERRFDGLALIERVEDQPVQQAVWAAAGDQCDRQDYERKGCASNE